MEHQTSLELPLIENNNQYEIDQSRFNSNSKTNDNIIIAMQDGITAKHDKIHTRSNIVSYVLLLIVGILYLIYGINKYNDSKNHPLTKFSQDDIDSYPLPTTIACVINIQSYFNISRIYYVDTNDSASFSRMKCDYTENPENIESLDNLETCLIIHKIIHNDVYNCFMIIPPSIITNMTDYKVSYVYWKKGFLSPDPFIARHTNYSSPSYLIDQETYRVDHAIVHLDDFLDKYQDTFTNNNYSLIIETAFEFFVDEGYQILPFSRSTMVLTYNEYTTLDNVVLKSFDVAQGIKTTSPDVHYVSCDYGICSSVILEYIPKRSRKAYLITKIDEYSDYEIPDLLSGIGGILSTAQGIIGTFLSLLLFGFGIWCINFKGLAPYPSFDDNFKIRIQRLINSQ